MRGVTRPALAALAVAAVAACSSPQAAQTSGTAAPAATAAPSLDVCTLYAQQHDAQIQVSPGDTSQCGELIKDLASSGTFWSYTPNGGSLLSLTVACDVTSPDGNYEAVALDDSGGFLGQEVCSDFASSGWTVNQEPGPLAQQISDQQGQAQQAEASASAASASAEASQSAEANAQDDVAALKQDTSLSGDVSQVGSDVTQTDSDLTQTRTDAAGGNGDNCTNADTTVYNDAATTVYNDVLTTVSNDVDTTGSDISACGRTSPPSRPTSRRCPVRDFPAPRARTPRSQPPRPRSGRPSPPSTPGSTTPTAT